MTKITFFRQARADGGMRTGISIDSINVFGHFTEGTGIPQPNLKWFVDVRCEGKLPNMPEEARRWLLQNKGIIKPALNEMAGILRAGMDVDSTPMVAKVPNTPEGVKIVIACTATSSLTGRDIAKALESTATNWVRLLNELRELQAA